ncbi:MAG TPA: filamentous hemagglutinin N-terminal domain-containing protein, partial [Ideonella sp.]|nr:filamentous hemagglutinin N-terminal domain-containing protein [Ideonella sp.]
MVHRPATPARDRTRNLSLALSPLVAALAAALPMQAHTKPVAAAVPVPSVSWRVSGTGGAAPVNKPNTAGGVDQTISQTSTRGIYNWQSFNIGDKSSVTFDMAQKGASALNRIGGNAPSQIFGKLSATNGGEIFLINANGILFGKGAQVNTGSLVASALNITDSEYLSGFAQSLANTFDPSLNAAFRYDGTPEDFIDSKNFVRVDPGASIATANGGRVFLFAKQVENAGSISTPGGQTVLAGGGEIYLKLPSAEAGLYAAESNPKVSVLRGFLVEVGAGPADSPEGDAGSAGNLATGVINTPRGNTTLIGMAVNQMGRISATTSVSENGSVILRAQGAAVRGGADSLRAAASGALTLGAGSQITITADTALDSSGKAPTSTDSAGFVASHIDLAGQSVLFDRGAAIVAPGATINVRAETVPSYQASLANAAAPATLVAGSDAARIVLREGASIDVAGSTGAVESVARHFVTTELLGSNDLKDAPVQKDGLLYRAKVTLDTRQDSAILGSLDSYRDSTQRGIEERLSEGGTVRLRAEGAVLTEAGSRIAVSGGKIRYTEAQIRETLLLGSDGKTYTLTDAPADLVYVGATSLQKSSLVSYDRWGVKLAFGTVSPARTELGYTEGRDAGAVEIAAPVVALQGALAAGSVQGERQQSGQDAQRASNGSLTLGAVYNGGAHFNNDRYLVDDLNTPTVDESGAVLRNFSVGDKSPKVDAGFWSEALEAALPEQSGLAQASLQQAGFDTVAIAATGAVRFGEPGSARYEMADSGRLSLLSLHGDVVLGSSLRSAHGKVEMISKVVGRDPVTLEFLAPGQVRVEDGVSVDLSGAWVNAYGLATGLQTSATGGGSFEASAYGVELGRSSVIDVSGGASASQAGVVSGAAAGSISLADNTELADARTDTLVLGGELRGYSSQATGGVSTGGGRLSLKTREVHIADAAEVDGAAGLWLAPSFFSAGGFGSFSVDGRLALDVAAGTVIAPQRQTWQAPTILPAQVLPPSGTATRDVLLTGLAPGLREGPVNLALASSGDSVDLTQGLLTLNAGASLQAGPQAAVSLSAAHQLVFDGRIESHGGSVALTLTKFSTSSPNFIWLGAGSEIDVSGTALLTPGLTNGLRLGQVLGGGQIKIDAAPPNTEKNPGLASSLVFQQGARLDAQGVSADLDVSERGDGGVRTQRRTLASAGGEISFAGNGQLLLEGDVDLHGGAGAAGGTLAVVLRGGLTDENQLLPPAHELRVTDRLASQSAGLTTATLAPPAGIALSSAVAGDWVAASGAADLSLSSTDALLLADNVQLNLDRKLSLVAGRFAAEAGTDSRLSGASVLISGTALPGASTASGGDAGLRVEARSGLVLDGKIATQGLGQIALVSAGDMRLQGSATVQGGGAYEGSLTTPAELSLSAAQIYPATDTRFTFNADGADVTISGGQPAAAKPLSAGGSLVVHAATITQGGVIRAPMGHLELNASEELRLLAGSETSVSAAGLVLPYGSYASELWTRPGLGAPLGTPPDKQIVLNAASVVSEAGSTLDASGGGKLFATEFVPGKGGSHDILAGGDGSYAIVPGVTGLAPHDPSYAATAASLGRQIEIARAVTLADGSVLPAGNYTLLPARYAMLPGAYLVRPSQAGGTALAAGTAVKGTDGSLLVGARLRDAGTGFGDALTSTWQVMDTATALRHSEIRTYDAGDVFAARATKAGTAAPPLPNDAGTLVVRATRARLEGEGRFSAAVDDAGRALGQGGRAEFVAENIQVDAGNVTADDGVLHLSAANLNRLGAQTVVLGATSAAAGDQAEALPSRTLQTQARSVVLAQGAQALTVPDLLASATDSIVVADNARFAPVAGSVASSTTPVYALQGDGAALRVAAAPGATLQRTAVEREAGRLQVGQGVQFDAGGGSLMLDSTGATTVSASARLDAADIGLAGGLVAVGGSAAKPNQLSLTPALTAQVSLADRLTLRGYQRIELADGAVLGSPALKALVLDTPHLRAAEASQLGAQVVAGDLTLVNTTGVAVNGAELGNGRLALQASTAAGGTGVLHIGGGDIGFNGVGQLALNADTAVASAGQSRLRVRGGLALNAPALVAEQAAAELSLVVGGLLRVDGPEGGVQPASAMGGVFTASADAIEMAGRIVLPTGKISLSGTRGVQLLDGARLLTAGASVKLDTQTVDLAGGEVSVASSSGDIAIAPGVRIDVSGGGSGGAGGSLSLSAPTGELQVGGTWLGTAGAGAQGASLDIDVGRALSPGHIAAKTEGGQFTDAITLRQREGDLVLGAAQTLRAHELSLSADGGALAVWGTLDASGAQGGSVTLTAQGDVALHSGASVLAQATAAGAEGGRVELGSTLGRLRLKEGSRIDLSAGAPDADGNTTEGGRLSLRAAQSGAHEVAIDRLAGTIAGAERIDVQAVRVYEGIQSIVDFDSGIECQLATSR